MSTNEGNNVAEPTAHARSTIIYRPLKQIGVQHRLKCPNCEVAQPVTRRKKKKRKRIRKAIANEKENSYVGGPLRRVRAALNNRLDLSVRRF